MPNSYSFDIRAIYDHVGTNIASLGGRSLATFTLFENSPVNISKGLD